MQRPQGGAVEVEERWLNLLIRAISVTVVADGFLERKASDRRHPSEKEKRKRRSRDSLISHKICYELITANCPAVVSCA